MDASLASSIEFRLRWASCEEWPPMVWTPRPYPVGTTPNILWLSRVGKSEFTVDGQQFRLEPGVALLSTSSQQRNYFHSVEKTEYAAVAFEADLFGHLDAFQALSEPVTWRPPSEEWGVLEKLIQQLSRLFQCARSSGAYDGTQQILVSGILRVVFGLCWRHLEATEQVRLPSQQDAAWLPQALEYLQNDPGVSVANWAKAVGFSPSHFRRIFAETMQLSPREYLTRHRLQKAQHLLRTTDLPVTHIAERLGYRSQPNFVQLVRRETALTPSQYRRQVREFKEELVHPRKS